MTATRESLSAAVRGIEAALMCEDGALLRGERDMLRQTIADLLSVLGRLDGAGDRAAIRGDTR